MAFKIIIKPIVFIDLDEAINWYESEQDGLAARFYESFETAIERIKNNPDAFTNVIPGVKRILLKSFLIKFFIRFQKIPSLFSVYRIQKEAMHI